LDLSPVRAALEQNATALMATMKQPVEAVTLPAPEAVEPAAPDARAAQAARGRSPRSVV